VKDISLQKIVNVWDHAFLVYRGDSQVLEFLNSIPATRTVVMDSVRRRRTWPWPLLKYSMPPILMSTAITCAWSACACYETPNNWADAVRDQVKKGKQ